MTLAVVAEKFVLLRAVFFVKAIFGVPVAIATDVAPIIIFLASATAEAPGTTTFHLRGSPAFELPLEMKDCRVFLPACSSVIVTAIFLVGAVNGITL